MGLNCGGLGKWGTEALWGASIAAALCARQVPQHCRGPGGAGRKKCAPHLYTRKFTVVVHQPKVTGVVVFLIFPP